MPKRSNRFNYPKLGKIRSRSKNRIGNRFSKHESSKEGLLALYLDPVQQLNDLIH